MHSQKKALVLTRLLRLGCLACLTLDYNVYPPPSRPVECQGCYSTSFNPQPFWRTEEEVATVCNENDDCIETAVIYKPNHLAFFEARVRMVQGPAAALDSAPSALFF